MGDIIGNEKIAADVTQDVTQQDVTQEDFYVAKDNINYERIRKICSESDFIKENQMIERDGGYISNFDVRSDVDLKRKLGPEDIFDDEIFLTYLAPFYSPETRQVVPGKFSGGFMITKFGIFSASFIHSNPFAIHVSFEELAEAQTIQEGFPDVYAMYSLVREPSQESYHWLMADERQIAFFVYRSAYESKPLITLLRELASSIRRDLGIGRVNILPQAPQDE